MEDNKDINMAVIAGATYALEYLQKNKNATHDDALKQVINNAERIIDEIDLSH